MIVKAHAVIPDAKAILRWIDVSESGDVALFIDQKAGERMQEAKRGFPVDGATSARARVVQINFLATVFSRLF